MGISQATETSGQNRHHLDPHPRALLCIARIIDNPARIIDNPARIIDNPLTRVHRRPHSCPHSAPLGPE